MTLAIVAILMAVAVPSMQSMSEKGKLREQTSRFESTLKYARGEAVARGVPVVMCASTDGETCAGDNRDEWDLGWFVFLDRNQDGEYTAGDCADDEDCLLRYYEGIKSTSSNATLTVRVASDVASFMPDGTLVVDGDANTALSIRVCMADSLSDDSNDQWNSATLTVAPNGSIRAIKGAAQCP